ncbi:MAG TPA: hypothetical protein VIJ75_01555 [Hanamia sp.]
MRKIYLLCFLFPSADFAEAQSLRKPIAAAYTGFGAYSVNHVDAFSIASNQAALAQIKNPSLSLYGEKRFLVEGTNMYSSIFALPTNQGNFAFQADYFGYANYNESQLGIAYARNVGTKLDVGVKFNYYSFRIPGYQNYSAVNFEIGAIAHLTEKLNAGIHFYNPLGGNLSKTDHEKLSSVYTFGIGYESSENFLISAEIVKQEDLPVNVNVGMQYNFDKQFFARFGIASQTASPYFGAGVSWDNLRIDVSASYHPQLGISPGLMLIVNFKSGNAEKE